MISIRTLRHALLLAGSALLAAGCATTGQEEPLPPRNATEANTTDANSHLVIAEIALQRGEYHTAAAEYAAAAQLSSEVSLAEQATRVAFENGQDSLALEAGRRWLELDPANLDAHRFVAVAALRLHQIAEATAHLEPVLKGGYASAAAGFLDLSTSLGEEENVFGVLQLMLGLAAPYERLAEAQYAVGTAALRAYNYDLAVSRSRRALELDPELIDAERLLARALVVNGQASTGLAIARSRAQKSGDAESQLEVVLLLTASGQEQPARDELKKLLDVPQARPDALRTLGALDLSAGNLDDAARNFNDLLGTGHYVSLAFYSLGSIYERRRDPLRAIRYYTRVGSGPFATDAQLRAARLLISTGARDQAIELLDTYVADHPEANVDITIGRARLLADEGDPQTALNMIEAALKNFPDNQSLHYSRSLMLERLDRIDDSINELEAMFTARPEDPVAMNGLGYTLAEHERDLKRARTLIRKSLEMTPDNPAVQDSMGWVLFRQGEYREALKWLTRAYSVEKDGEIAAHLGETLWALGQRPQARAIWDQALAEDPNHRYLLNTLRRYPD